MLVIGSSKSVSRCGIPTAWDVSLAEDSLPCTLMRVFMRGWVWQHATPAALLTLCSVECVSSVPSMTEPSQGAELPSGCLSWSTSACDTCSIPSFYEHWFKAKIIARCQSRQVRTAGFCTHKCVVKVGLTSRSLYPQVCGKGLSCKQRKMQQPL